MILYTENPKDSTKKLLELINEFSKAAGCKVHCYPVFLLLFTFSFLEVVSWWKVDTQVCLF